MQQSTSCSSCRGNQGT